MICEKCGERGRLRWSGGTGMRVVVCWRWFVRIRSFVERYADAKVGGMAHGPSVIRRC